MLKDLGAGGSATTMTNVTFSDAAAAGMPAYIYDGGRFQWWLGL